MSEEERTSPTRMLLCRALSGTEGCLDAKILRSEARNLNFVNRYAVWVHSAVRLGTRSSGSRPADGRKDFWSAVHNRYKRRDISFVLNASPARASFSLLGVSFSPP